MNSLDYYKYTPAQNFFTFTFQNEIFPVTINEPMRVTRTSATARDHILTNSIFDKKIQSIS